MSTRPTAKKAPAAAPQPAQPTQPSKLTALQRWASVQRKQIDAATLDWLAIVAEGILAAAGEPEANKRRQAVLNATGIAGKLNRDSHLAEVAAWAAMQPGVPEEERRGLQRQVVELLLNLPEEKADDDQREAMRKRVERARARVTKKA